MDSVRSSVNAVIEDLHFQSQNQLSNRLNEIDQIKLVPDKKELREILHSVSLLDSPAFCKRKTVENSEHSNKDLKITAEFPKRNEDEDSDDEIEIIDVVVGNNHLHEISSNVPSIESTILNPTEVRSSSTKNMSDAEMGSVNENEICEGNIQVMTKPTLNNDICLVPVIVHADNNSNDSALVSNSKVDSVSVSSTLTNFDSNCNLSEICTTENTKNFIDIMECDIASDSATCDDVLDLTNASDENHFYDIEYDFKHTTIQLTGCWKEFSSGKRNNFTRGCKWAPDGSCILTCSDDNKLRIFNLPSQLWDSSQWSDISELESALRITEGDLIYDFCWYPLMSSSDPSTCCLASTSRKNTVHMWDAYTGELRCSYRCFNHLDELVTPHSLCFNTDGEKLYCGFKNAVRIFDVNRPGRYFEERPVYAQKYGQSGIISCFAFTSADKNISAAGSYRSTIGLYAEPNGELLSLFEAQTNGITQLQFSPDGKYLYSGGRKDPEILCWDIRDYSKVLFSMRRSCETNQRMYFDISKCGKYLVSGNHNGVITFWDVTQEPKIVKEDDFPILVPMHFFMAHNDCVNGISFHPSYPLLCSSSGQRKVPTLLDDDSEHMFSNRIEQEDNSLRLWWIGKLNK